MLFIIYIDNLFLNPKPSGLGCHDDLTFAVLLVCSDDIALVSPSIYGLKQIISIYELYAQDYRIHVTFNLENINIIFNISSSEISPIYYNGTLAIVAHKDIHLGSTISIDIYDRNIISNVCINLLN